MGLVYWGGYRLFEKVMGVGIVLMFVTVVTTAIVLQPEWDALLSGLLLPSIPDAAGWNGLAWTMALMGGVGGTVTILSYGYWIREEGRTTPKSLRLCRLDLATGYLMTALFGIAMVVIGSRIEVQGGGATLVIQLADSLVGELGPIGKWIFLIGAWGAIFSSLLGVWQSVPYLFADLWRLMQTNAESEPRPINTKSTVYRGYLYALSIVPMIGLWVGFANMQKYYAIVGAIFIPMLALVLLILNGQSSKIGEQYRNRPITTLVLSVILVFFMIAGGLTIKKVFGL